jgi:ATP-dependent DNA helicase RecQ
MTSEAVASQVIDPSGVELPWPVLSVDIESNPADDNRIFLLGAIRSDNAQSLTLNPRRTSAPELRMRLDDLASGSRFIVGHNFRRHDAVALSAQFAGLKLLSLPILDTLELSAIAFPTNPYHRLVKGYKLLSDSRNDPLKDARLTLDLLRDEIAALRAMHSEDPVWTSVLHVLVRADEPLRTLMAHVRGAPVPTLDEATDAARTRFRPLCCSTALTRLTGDAMERRVDDQFALAYALGWIRVAGGNSVLPIWVHESIPEVRALLAELRERDCGQSSCSYCREQHNPEHLLTTFFQKPSFRGQPAAPDGTSLQRAIVAAGLQRQSLLAVLPTGGGKSICYQLPALVHYWRTGQLTVIISPLQSLMKDQVDNLIAAGVTCAVTINGLLTPLERRAALDKVRLGDAGIVLVSPEQFRSRSFTDVLRMREIATWVFDEAHCLSKWGHDFRTDYLYVSRFIRENLSGRPAPVACFTATAKPDVIEDLCGHFRDSLGLELAQFLGGHERANLSYTVVEAKKAEKAQRIAELLRYELRDGGAAVVFCATRKTAETYTEVLEAARIRCECFHGGLSPDVKKEVQTRFIAGETPVIAATNAFGMGVDKPDIRVVIHADIPGSLENYLQEAGRAGRDGGAARCVLLFDEEDVETQFRLSASSQLTPRDFTGILKGIRGRARRMKSTEIVVSARELLADSDGVQIDIESRDATTKVSTAVAWLERGGFLKRDENSSRVFPASLRVSSLEEALARIQAAKLSEENQSRFGAVAATLFRSQAPEGVSTDELMLDAGIPPDECFRILYQLENLGILTNDLGLTVRITKGVKGASDLALEFLDRMERELLDLMSDAAPDAEVGGEPQHLAVRLVCTELRRRLEVDEGDARVSPQRLRDCLRSLSETFGSGSQKRSMIHVRGLGPDSLRITLHRPWSQIRSICERRRAVAQVVLRRLMQELPEGTRESGLIVECKARDLIDAIEGDIELRGTLKEPAVALEHALLYMHENKVLDLDKGRSVFRSAMTLRIDPDSAKRRFLKEDFAPLEEFYRERTLQTHVMHEYAKLGLTDPAAAAALVTAYFTWPRRKFVREFFKGRKDLFELATTEESFRRIVDDLHHPVQQALVEKPAVGNHLVLAGPGSGKTRVLVHRIAYLLRVRRVAPERIIALAFNRSAATELRRRLLALVGDDVRGVTVMTYHALALRLTGTSLSAASQGGHEVDFGKLLQDAVTLLEGGGDTWGEADDVRDRLLQGYEYIFVDEYQDIDEHQYALVSALAGRRRTDPDAKLSIMAVGDDDQNIYSFKGANVEFIRRFQRDYGGEVTYLVENFRSTQNIIAAANHIIQRGQDRMKVDHPIRINDARAKEAPGGRWQDLDAATRGQVKLISAPVASNLQAQLVLREIERLLRADPGMALSEVAVLARTHRSLEPVRAACELAGLRYQLLTPEASAATAPLMQSREGWRIAGLLRQRRSRLLRIAAMQRWIGRQRRREQSNPYWEDIAGCIDEFAAEARASRVTASELLEALHEAGREARRSGQVGAIRLMTAHGAKGLEFPHVIIMDCGDWRWTGDDERRLLYVGMTRARETLVLMRAEDGRNACLVDLATVAGVVHVLPEPRPVRKAGLERRYVSLGPAEVDLGFAGRRPPSDPVHGSLAGVRVGDAARISGRIVETADGRAIGKLAAKVSLGAPISSMRVTGIMVRTKARTDPQYLDRVQCEAWEVVLAELVFEGGDDVESER